MNPYDKRLELPEGSVLQLDLPLETPSVIHFGRRILDALAPTLAQAVREKPVDQIFLVTDSTVGRFFAPDVSAHLREHGFKVVDLRVADGEEAKTAENSNRLAETLVDSGATKSSVIMALGGGCVGNVAGYVAGTLFRGVRFVEIPTSFTHQTDGTLSHKQAINGRSGKNHFGLYHAPIFTWTDTQYLSTEPLKLKNAGLVEGIKNALIDQPSLLPHLRRSLRADGHYSAEESTDLAYKIILSKLEILAKDPSERKFAIVLEYGHTFAHAIEWLAAGTLIHGECVSIGMRIAARLAESLGAIDGELARLHEDILDFDLEMRPALPASASADAIIAAMKSDNKRTGSDLRFVLLEGLGRCANREGDWLITVPDAAVKQILEAFLSRYPTEKPKVPARAGRWRIRDLRIPTIRPGYPQPALGDRP